MFQQMAVLSDAYHIGLDMGPTDVDCAAASDNGWYFVRRSDYE